MARRSVAMCSSERKSVPKISTLHVASLYLASLDLLSRELGRKYDLAGHDMSVSNGGERVWHSHICQATFLTNL